MNKNLSTKKRIYTLKFIIILSIYIFVIPKATANTPLDAARLNHKAMANYITGDYKNALSLYSEALRIDRSIEDIDGIAVNLINLSIIYRKRNDYNNALKCVNEVFDHLHPEHGHTLRLSEAAIVKTLIFIDTKEYSKAWELVEKGLTFPKNNDTNTTGRLYNLKTRLLLIKNEPHMAISMGMKAMQANKQNKDDEETSNSLRLLAESKTILKEYRDAENYYKQALELDKSSNLSRKIGLDLFGLGKVASLEEKKDEAAIYFQRALAIFESHGDPEGIKYFKKTINELKVTKDSE